jgi:hypothetical protein
LTYDQILGEATLLSKASTRHFSVIDPAHYAGYFTLKLTDGRSVTFREGQLTEASE